MFAMARTRMLKASIIIPVFNAASYIEETLRSIFAQSFTDYEIVIVDDGSTDGTSEIISTFADPRILYLYQTNSGRPAVPRNRAIRESSGDIIFIFDSDDVMLPDKLGKTVELLTLAPSAGLAFTGFACIDESGKIINPNFLAPYHTLSNLPKTQISDSGFLIKSHAALKGLASANYLGTSGVAIRREVFDTVGFFDEQVRNSDDFLMWQAIASQYDFAYTPELYHHYRVRSGSISLRRIEERAPGLIACVEKMKRYHAHDADSIRLLDEKIRRYHFEAGYSHFSQYQLRDARRSFLQALKKRLDRQTLRYLALTMLPASVLSKLKHLKTLASN